MRPTAATLRGGMCCDVDVMAARGECAHPTWHHRHATVANQAWGPHPDSETLPPLLPHAFAFGSNAAAPKALDYTESYKYLGVHFSNTGNPSDYMLQAPRAMAGAYWSMRQRVLRPGLRQPCAAAAAVFSTIAASAAMYGGELWGVHPCTAAERGRTARNTRSFCGSCYASHPAPALRLT